MVGSHPYFAELSATILDFTIGYLHLTFLGIITVSIFALGKALGHFEISRAAFLLYVIGFLITELLIFQRGIAAWLGFSGMANHSELLAFGSGVIIISLILVCRDNIKYS